MCTVGPIYVILPCTSAVRRTPVEPAEAARQVEESIDHQRLNKQMQQRHTNHRGDLLIMRVVGVPPKAARTYLYHIRILTLIVFGGIHHYGGP